ncbi:sulfur carrier protein ThiS [Acinetobacter nectaris]|uniref:sulfur carrier protein ThiS n=1 Tax=Acinetobacter nectaris TaxID=1219382 RepID=UPI001F01F99E|nr:sulfur carrier protein ThiS [Acinetobacter nectaris]MCF8998214.1 sulfur carrier protein ThiS [Acinetobacter nectaris]MCF9026860.1 sulfur carrier protein ThiS [Acinetobacter nectaris]
MKEIFLNGELTEISCKTLKDLVHTLNLENKRFAIEVNEQIIPKSKLECFTIHTQDKIEIIQAVGGG